MRLPRLNLRKNEERRIRLGHQWVYANEIDTRATPLKAVEPGELVQLCDHRERPLGLAFADPHALICARLVSREAERTIDQAFFAVRLRVALALRERLFARAPYYRLVYGDSDDLPGIVADRYGDYLVVQLTIPGTRRRAGEIVAALVDVVRPTGVLVQSPAGGAEDDLAGTVDVMHGDVPQELEVREGGARFHCTAQSGQKTGWFYDHRPSRQRLAELAKGQRVLDVFSYIGAWGVQAAVAGAAHVTCIDASGPAMALAARNAADNGVGDRVRTLHGDAFERLRELAQAGERFDVVVLDPPAFIKRRKDQQSGEEAYRRLNGLAMSLLTQDALLFSASCSLHLAPERLLEMVRGAAHKAGRRLQLLEQLGQGPDHPVHPAIPETRYLKTLLCRATEAESS